MSDHRPCDGNGFTSGRTPRLLRSLRGRTRRLAVLVFMLAGVMTVFAARLVQLQVWQQERWAELSSQNHRRTRTVEVRRGDITDRNGLKLALSTEVYSVHLYTPEIASLSETATLLAAVLPTTRDEILATVGNRRGYLRIARNLPVALAERIRALRLPGVVLEEGFRRIYPERQLAANILGFCGADGAGLEGLELKFDKTLRGYPGLVIDQGLSVRSSDGSSRVTVRPPTGGSNLGLTIDAVVQHILEGELAEMVAAYSPHDAMAVAMDPRTGEILGMAGWPTFDLNEFGRVPPEFRRNRIAMDLFEPGSCMKIFAMAAGFHSGKISEATRFHCRGYSEIHGKRIKCHGGHGLVDPREAIAESCNSAMVDISQLVAPRDLFRTYRDFGFGEPSGIELPGEEVGILRPPSRWSGLSAPSIAIGQEVAVTGLQLVAAYGAIANDGWLLAPRLVKQISSAGGTVVEEFGPAIRRQVLSAGECRRLREMLAGVVDHGTGKLARVNDYTIGGKTSTAQKANPRGGYFREKVVTSFIGLAPALNPRLVLLVLANEPKGDERTLFGGKVAAPYFARMTERILSHLKVQPDRARPDAASHPTRLTLPVPGAESDNSLIVQAGPAFDDEPSPSPGHGSARVSLVRASEPAVADPSRSPPRSAPTATAAVSAGTPPRIAGNAPAGETTEVTTGATPADRSVAASDTSTPSSPRRVTMPDLRGLTIREVTTVLKDLPIQPVLEGNGVAIHQSWPAGTPLDRVERLVVHFSPRAALAVPPSRGP